MNENTSSSLETLRGKIREAVASGNDIRKKVQAHVSDTLHQAELDGDGLKQMAAAILDGAREGYQDTDPEQQESRFREVIDGLADGVRGSAEILKLTVEEATAEGKRFTQNDLRLAALNLRALARLFGGVLKETATQTSKEAAEHWNRVQTHASDAWQRIQPECEAALKSVSEDPLGTGADAVKAGVQTASHAAGALFKEMGRRLQSIGERIQS